MDKAIQIDCVLETGIAGGTFHEIIDINVPEFASDQEIEEIAEEECRDWALNKISFGYQIIKQ